MSLSDPRYLLFLAAVVVFLPFVPAGKLRLAVLALVSLAFYMIFSVWYGALLVGVAGFTFAAGRLLLRLSGDLARRVVLTAAIMTALAPLLVFKYLGAASDGLGPVGAQFNFLKYVALPVGISFYTFQAVGYIIDTYVENVEPETDFIRFCAFLYFFPILLAGPIERAGHLLPQLDRVGEFDYARSVAGLRAILTGLYLKIVIADNLAPLVERVYAQPTGYGALDLALATIYFSFQVYADFAGYSLIAIGSARLLGIELLPNFAQPFLSQSLPEYWRTWHMTLSGWFRDYMFTPLQFQWRRRGRLGLVAALVITFTVVGIWHGAGTKYAIFGVIHGVLVSWSTLTLKARERLWTRIGIPALLIQTGRIFLTFSTVTLTFVLFRAGTTEEAVWIYKALASGVPGSLTLSVSWPFALIGMLVLYDLATRYNYLKFLTWSSSMRLATYHLAATTIFVVFCARLADGVGSGQQFIYFKF